ncbi:MAG: hypothetical protein H7323_16705 [Frankiales bacterium]|nr:hypothetical protein [Frankiales bacterium]
MTHPSPYGPQRASARLMMPVVPDQGWALADTRRRVAAVLALPLAGLLVLLTLDERLGTDSRGLLVWLVVGPAAFYSLARVLRPEPRDPERTPRHLLASAATSFGLPVIALSVLAGGGGDFGGGGPAGDSLVVGLGSIAFCLGVLTVLWGLLAVLVRAVRNAPAAAAPATATPRS